MKKVLILIVSSLLLYSCGSTEDADFLRFSSRELVLNYGDTVKLDVQSSLDAAVLQQIRYMSADTNFVKIWESKYGDVLVKANHVTFNGAVSVFAYSGNFAAACPVIVEPEFFLFRVPKINWLTVQRQNSGAGMTGLVNAIKTVEALESYPRTVKDERPGALVYEPASNERDAVDSLVYHFDGNGMVVSFVAYLNNLDKSNQINLFLTERYAVKGGGLFYDGTNDINVCYSGGNIGFAF